MAEYRHLALVRQVMAAMIQGRPFAPSLLSSPRFPGWSSDAVRCVLASVPRHFFLSPRSVGRQRVSTRHRSPLRQRDLRREAHDACLGLHIGGPAAYSDPARVRLGVAKALEFYCWVASSCGFAHDEGTCREMARVLARANALRRLWDFLRENQYLVGTPTVTDVIKVLGEEGLTREALAAFYRMKQLHCKPDVQTYNVLITALCRVGNLKKARFLLEQMELPGALCPADTYTYTILIAAYCRRSIQTGCRKAVRRRLWEANHMFRHMLFRGFVPDTVTYNCLIDGLCKTYRIGRALELFDDMLLKGCAPNRVTYNSFIRYFSAVNEVDKAVEMMRLMVSKGHGVPTSSSYTPIIHALCEGGRVSEARDFLLEMVNGGTIPREYTYKLVNDSLVGAGEAKMPVDVCRIIKDGIDARMSHLINVKPLIAGRFLLDHEKADITLSG
ncbi:hypothetical protein Taro_052999 [Colocasia esculenta]|uniref:Pentatricopeptide repeat-containing protein n=1 Tax=Colocasia esculenta TaxID=4460 RepID=A0A843XLQ8_COLES|nr:hypothetical protein [Colocasia esculenta]